MRIIPVLSILILAYFGYHGIWGNRGFFRLLEIREQIEQAQNLKQLVAEEKATLQYKTKALKNPQTIDPDVFEEQVLRVLGQTKNDNLVLFD